MPDPTYIALDAYTHHACIVDDPATVDWPYTYVYAWIGPADEALAAVHRRLTRGNPIAGLTMIREVEALVTRATIARDAGE